MAVSSHDGHQDLVAPFKALANDSHRREASVQLVLNFMIILADQVYRLKTLVETLTRQQIRELRLLVGEVDFNCDIIAQLPLEISQRILQYLPLYQVFEARRVSSQWNQILSSAQTVEPLLRDWYPKRDDNQGLQIPDGLSADSVAALKAEHIDAYRTGHAFTYAMYWSDAKFPNPYRMAYADGIVAWIEDDDSSVRSLDLKTGQECSFRSETGIKLHTLAISSSMIAALESGRCHVWALRTEDHYSLQLPSAWTPVFDVSSECLAIAHLCELTLTGGTGIEVSIWALKDQITSSFALPPQELADCWTVMLDEKRDSLLFFEQKHDRFYHYTRTSLDGNILSRGVIEHHARGYLDCSQNRPKEVNGQAVIWSLALDNSGEDEYLELVHISFNFQEDRLEIHKQKLMDYRMRICGSFTPALYFHKGTAYFLEEQAHCQRLRIINLQDSTSREARMDFPAAYKGFGREIDVGLDPQEWTCAKTPPLGDEVFFIIGYRHHLYVWCFDANVRLFNKNDAYSEERKVNAERRLGYVRSRS